LEAQALIRPFRFRDVASGEHFTDRQNSSVMRRRAISRRLDLQCARV